MITMVNGIRRQEAPGACRMHVVEVDQYGCGPLDHVLRQEVDWEGILFNEHILVVK